MADKLTANERASYRGWSIDYAIRANTKRNLFCACEDVAPIEKVLSDAQKIFDYMVVTSEPLTVINIKQDSK